MRSIDVVSLEKERPVKLTRVAGEAVTNKVSAAEMVKAAWALEGVEVDIAIDLAPRNREYSG